MFQCSFYHGYGFLTSELLICNLTCDPFSVSRHIYYRNGIWFHRADTVVFQACSYTSQRCGCKKILLPTWVQFLSLVKDRRCQAWVNYWPGEGHRIYNVGTVCIIVLLQNPGSKMISSEIFFLISEWGDTLLCTLYTWFLVYINTSRFAASL